MNLARGRVKMRAAIFPAYAAGAGEFSAPFGSTLTFSGAVVISMGDLNICIVTLMLFPRSAATVATSP